MDAGPKSPASPKWHARISRWLRGLGGQPDTPTRPRTPKNRRDERARDEQSYRDWLQAMKR